MDKNGILLALSTSEKTSLWKRDFVDQSEPQKVFAAIWVLEAEVNNRGFSQYFENQSCETAGYATKALETIGALQTADICKRAIACAFPEGLPPNPDAISSTANKFSDITREALGSLDQEFFSYPHDLTELLFAFVTQHPEEFGKVVE